MADAKVAVHPQAQNVHPVDHHADYLHASKGIKSWLTTVDHKRIGIMYLWSVAFFFLLGGLAALTVRLELLTPNQDFIDADTYNQMFTMHGVIMVFLFIIPAIPAALGNFLLPIMLGTKDVAFPRLNLASYYVYVVGAIFGIYSMVTGAVDTGWTFYTPYSIQSGTSVISMVLAAFILGFSSIFTGLNMIVTIHKMRAPGMTWNRLPLFVWAIYATSIVQVLATPVLGITLLLLILERSLEIGIFNPALGGDPVLFQHFFWFYSHPAVYIMILPGFGVISELIATFSRRKIYGYTAIALSSVAIAFLGFLVWGHHMFVSGQSEVAAIVFSLLTFLVGIPSGVKVFNWVATLYKGSIWLKAPMLYALIFLFLFTIGGLTGIMVGVLAIDVHLHDTYFVVAHFHYVMMGGTVMAFLGGVHYWWPKMFGRMYNEKLAAIGAALVFIGFNMTFFTQFVLGSQGMPRRYWTYVEPYQPLHAFSTYGSWVLGAGLLLTLLYLLHSLWRGQKAPANPWGAIGLEWQTSSPPTVHNFERLPIVTHGPYDYDVFYAETTGDGASGDGAPVGPHTTRHPGASGPKSTHH